MKKWPPEDPVENGGRETQESSPSKPLSPGKAGSQETLSAALHAFQVAWERGDAPDPEVYCRTHPEAGPELLSRIHDFLFVAQGLGVTDSLGDGSISPPPQPEEEEIPGKIGPYRVIRLLGEGGMGAVYLVEQTEPVRRLAALKLIKKGMDSKRVLQRFEAERQALVMMDHSSIARVLDAGAAGTGQPYFVMEYIEGLPIRQYCRRKALGVDERIRLFRKVCAGVRHAHQKGVVHRDLKPGNILVTEKDGQALPKIIDFGLARAMGQRLVEGSLYSLDGQIIGTPEYMSPEQAGYKGQDVDTRTDVYSLGVVLYELLTGESPYSGEEFRKGSVLEIQKRLFEEEPVRPSTKVARRPSAKGPCCGLEPRVLARRLQGDLDWIILKALEKDRERRYQSVADLSDDLERYLRHEPIQARPPSIVYRGRKYLRKHGLLLGAAAVVFLVIFGALFFSLQEARARILVEQENRKMAQEKARKEQEFRKRLQRTLAFARSTANSLVEMAAIKQKEDQGAEDVLWTEDFEEYPLGALDFSSESKGRWRLGGDNQNVRVVSLPGQVKGSGRCLDLEGCREYPDGAVVSTPMDPESHSYLADFTIEFKIRPTEGSCGKRCERGGVGISTRPDWRGENGYLFTIQKDWRVPVGKDRFLKDPFPSGDGLFHHVRIHYKRIGPGRVQLNYFLDTRPVDVVERKAFPYEDRLVWFQVTSGAGHTWFDDFKVTRPPRARTWRKCPFAPGHEYMLTPRPMSRPMADALARRWGGRLASAARGEIRRWFLHAFGHGDFWVAGSENQGLFPFVAGSLIPGDAPELIPDIRTRDGDALLPGVLEFPRHPPMASAVRTGPGCAGDLGEVPRLLAASPPVAGESTELVLDGVPPGDRAFLAVGKKDACLDLSTAKLPGCRLLVAPELCLPLEPGTGRSSVRSFHLALPGDPSLFGRTLFFQAVLAGKGPGLRPKAFSNGLRLRLGIEPPRGSLAWAAEGGMSSPPEKKPVLRGLAALPWGGALLAGSYFGDLVFPAGMESWPAPGRRPGLEGRGKWDGFLARMGPFGRVRWAKTLGGKGVDRVEALRLLQGGETALLLGLFQEEAFFGEGPRGETLHCAKGTGIFSALYNTRNGELVRARKIGEGDPSGVEDLRLAIPPGGIGAGFYVSGLFRGKLHLGGGGDFGSLSAGEGRALFLARFDREGNLLWVRKAVSSRGGLLSGGLCALSDGSAALAGSFKRDLVACPGTAREVRFQSPHGYWEIFLARFRPGGGLDWARHALGMTDDFARDLACSSDGSLFLTGGIHHQVRFWEGKEEMEVGSGGGLNIFLARFKEDGTPLWGTRAAALGGNGEGRSIAVREEGGKIKDIYLTGFFDLLISFKKFPYRPGLNIGGTGDRPYSNPLVPMGKGNRKDIFLACFRSDGDISWASQAGGIGDDKGLYLSLLPGGSPLVAGTFMGPATFGLGEPNQTVLVQGTLFAAKFRK